jgi:uncharacterized membrane protein YfcA
VRGLPERLERASLSGVLLVVAAVWISALEWRRRQFARSRWLVPVLFGLFALMGVLAFDLDSTSPLGWVVVAAILAIGTVSIVHARRALPRIDELLVQLRARAAAGAGAGDAGPVLRHGADR